MRIFMCDDDGAFMQELIEKIKKELLHQNLSAEINPCSNGNDLLKAMKESSADAVFLDIDMPEMSGFEVALELKDMQKPPAIIFVSSMENLVFEAFEYRPFWFLRKSQLEELPKVIAALAERERLLRETFTFEFRKKIITLPLEDILYFESRDHYVMIHTTDESYSYKGGITKKKQRNSNYF